ncbi:MAG: Rpn family recombination-promoting nuclease/putative transposase [Candidatus Paracaedibacter sp.]
MTNENLYTLNTEADDETRELIDGLKSFGQGGEYADPTTDTGFKHLLSPAIEENKEIIKSFLNTFVPAFAHDAVKDVREASIAVPALPKPKLKQTFMDMHVISQSGCHYVIEMQAHRHINLDERALYYTASALSQQLSEQELQDPMWYRNLKPTIGIQVLGYDSNRVIGLKDSIPDNLLEQAKAHPLPDGQYMKHYIMTDRNSGQEIKHLQMIQIELPRARANVFPPKKDFSLTDWWLSVFKYAPLYTKEAIQEFEAQSIVMPLVISQALERLYFPKWNPREISEYKTDTIEKEKYVIEFASEREEGREEGREEERQKHEEEKRTIARKMLAKGMSIEEMSEMTGLSAEEIQELV